MLFRSGYLKEDDVIVFNPYELLHVAKVEARAMFDAGPQMGRRQPRSILTPFFSAVATHLPGGFCFRRTAKRNACTRQKHIAALLLHCTQQRDEFSNCPADLSTADSRKFHSTAMVVPHSVDE